MSNNIYQNYGMNNNNNSNKLTDSVVTDYMARRQMEFPAIKMQNNNGIQMKQLLPADININLAKILSTIPIISSNPSIIPALINKIMSMPQMIEKLTTDQNQFRIEISNPSFLQMLITQINNDSNPKNRPMDLSEQANIDPNQQQQHIPLQLQLQNPMNNNNIQLLNQGQGQNNFGMTMTNVAQSLLDNVLPTLTSLELMDYSVSLLYPNDLMEQKGFKYVFKFDKFANISKISLTSLVIEKNIIMQNEQCIYVKIDEFQGRCFMSNQQQVFGKMILVEENEKFLHYRMDYDTCMQVFSNPQIFEHLTISFIMKDGKMFDPTQININKKSKMKSRNELKIETKNKHGLLEGQQIKLQIIKKDEIDEYTVDVKTIENDNIFYIDNVSENDDKFTIRIFKVSFFISLSFKFYEINWNQITGKSIQSAQLTKLGQLITNNNSVENVDTPIINYIKSKYNLI